MKALSARRPAGLVLALLALASFGAAPLPAQAAPARGLFLVASDNLGDPNFYQTVVLLLDYSEQGALGLIVNRPTAVSLAELFPKTAAVAARKQDRVYLGGPVEREQVRLLLRRRGPAEGFERVAGDLYSGGEIAALAELLASDNPPTAVRGYAGYAGWGPGQLDREIEQGAWLVLQSSADQVFDPQPEGLWRRLFDGAQMRFARAAPKAKISPALAAFE
ncbi:MAG: YqgE/AlgH family protein [Acidobacteria bacterium]|nr:YqgE/AlgH family protein [Acidobacteriota bacterium]